MKSKFTHMLFSFQQKQSRIVVVAKEEAGTLADVHVWDIC